MKKFRKTMAVLIAVSILLSATIFSANAAIPPQKIGDVNADQVIDITDATLIQRHLAKIEYIYEGFHGLSEAADVDDDCKITIADVTLIQRYLASFISEFPAGEEYLVDKYLFDVHTSYDSGKAMAGVPVTFYVNGYCEPSPTTVKLFVNDVEVAQTQEYTNYHDYTLSYTFEEAGVYQLRVFICDKWGYGISQRIDDYVVVDVPEDKSQPIITAVYRDNSSYFEPEITALVEFGTAPYQYKFTLTDYYFEDNVIRVQDFSDSNKFQVEYNNNYYFPPYDFTIIVDVVDAEGNTVSGTYKFETVMIDPA